MLDKVKDSVLILTTVLICPAILKPFGFPFTLQHQIGFLLIGIGSIGMMWINLNKLNSQQIIEKVFELQKVEIDGKYPKVKKEVNNE